jgi:preprotein translocase subunit SecD/SecD/SecF fusion protein
MLMGAGAAEAQQRGSVIVLGVEQPSAAQQVLDVQRKRLDRSNIDGVTITEKDSRIEVKLPPAADRDEAVTLLTTPGQMSLNLVDGAADPKDVASKGRRVLPSVDGKSLVVFADPVVISSDIADAIAGFSSDGRPAVMIRLKPGAAGRVGKATADNINRQIAIVVDDRILFAPVVRTAITDGRLEIDGSFTLNQAADLAALLQSGPLPSKVTVVERRQLP